MAAFVADPPASPHFPSSDDESSPLKLEEKVKWLDAENKRLKKELGLMRKSLVARNVQDALHLAGLSVSSISFDALPTPSDSSDEAADRNSSAQLEIVTDGEPTASPSLTYVASPEMIAATASAAAMAARASIAAALNGGRGGKARKKAAAAEVDLSHYPRRYVALRMMYLGARYHGFASQPGNMLDMTVESKLFAALEKTRMLPPGGRTEAQYSRCGRTDKGVSALGQVVALWLRSCRRPQAPSVGNTRTQTKTVSCRMEEALGPRLENASAEAASTERSEDETGAALPHAADAQPLGIPPMGRGTWDMSASVLVNPELSQSVVQVERDKGEVELADWSPQGLKQPQSEGWSEGAGTDKGGGGEPTDWVLLETEPDGEGGVEFPISHDQANDGDWSDGDSEDIDYIAAINRALPEDIRVTGWAPVRTDFDARFSCKFREYKYFFVRGSLDLEAMEKAAALFVGTYDFRNFCRMDTRNVKSFERTVHDCSIERASSAEGWAGCELFYIRVRGRAFLWHQVRCMAAILFMVGHAQESPEIVRALLDLRQFPRKPQYQMASELPLLLHTCGFEDLHFRSSPEAARQVSLHLERLLHATLYPAAMLREALLDLAQEAHQPAAGKARTTTRGHSHVPLKLRGAEPTHEERLQKLGLL